MKKRQSQRIVYGIELIIKKNISLYSVTLWTLLIAIEKHLIITLLKGNKMEAIVLKQAEAIDWLKKEARNLISDYTDSSYDSESVADIIKDLLEYIDLILKEDWEWVMIDECAMAVSNIMVSEMKKAQDC